MYPQHTQYIPGTAYDLPGTTHTVLMCLQYSYSGSISSHFSTAHIQYLLLCKWYQSLWYPCRSYHTCILRAKTLAHSTRAPMQAHVQGTSYKVPRTTAPYDHKQLKISPE